MVSFTIHGPSPASSSAKTTARIPSCFLTVNLQVKQMAYWTPSRIAKDWCWWSAAAFRTGLRQSHYAIMARRCASCRLST